MKLGLAFLLILLGSLHSEAKDDLISVHGDIYTGPATNSASGNFGYGLSLGSFNAKGNFFYGISGSLSMASGPLFIASQEHSATLTSFDLNFDGAFRPFKSSTISPYLGLGVAFGFMLVEMDSPPVGSSNRSMGIVTGGRAFIGSDIKIKSHVIRGQVNYSKKKSSAMFGSATDLDSINVALGLLF